MDLIKTQHRRLVTLLHGFESESGTPNWI